MFTTSNFDTIYSKTRSRSYFCRDELKLSINKADFLFGVEAFISDFECGTLRGYISESGFIDTSQLAQGFDLINRNNKGLDLSWRDILAGEFFHSG